MNQFTHRVVMALATFALAIATGSVGTVLTAKAAEAISSSSVLIEQQAAGVRFSVQDESTVALRLEVLSLDGRRIFQSEWRPDKTVVWSAALITGQTVANGVYLYAISVRDREGREQRKLGKLVLVQGLEPRLSIPAVSELVTTEPAAAQFPLTAGTSWSQRLGIDRSDTYRILRRPARVPGGPVTSFEQLLQLGANGRLHITELCLGTVFAPFTAQNPDNLSNGGDCRSSWSGVTGGGTSNGWTDDGAIVRLATASDKVGIGTTTPAQALEVNGIASLGAPGGVYGYLFAAPSPGPYPTLGFNTYGAPFYLAGVAGYGGILQFQDGDGKLIYYTGSNVAAGAAHVNTPRFAIDKDGNVGVGTTTPTAKLSVQTGTGFYGFIHTDGAIVVGSYVGGSASGAVGGWLGTKSNHQLHFFTNNGQPSMTIDTAGRVGIGTFSPSATLDVNGGIQANSLTAPAGLFLNASTGRIALRTTTGGLFAERMTILDNGNVGIGTTSPTNPLQMGSGAFVSAGGIWTNASDRNLKEHFTPVDSYTVLKTLAALPITAWNYKTEGASIQHIGPVAQDFYAAFKLGQDNKHISTIDANGVALLSIQALYELSLEKDKQIEDLQQRIEKLEKLVEMLTKK